MKISRRSYRSGEDDHLVRELLSRSYSDTGHPYLSVDPSNWARISAAARLDSQPQIIQLWELKGHPGRKVVGLLLYHQGRREYTTLVDPGHRDIEVVLVDWVESTYQTGAANQKDRKALTCTVCEKNEAQKALLTDRGYVKGEIGTVFRKRSLDTEFLQMALPQGYSIQEVRSLSKERFVDRATAETDLFGDQITVAFLRELNQDPYYRPQFDLVITAPNASIAALTTAWFDEGHQAGYFEPVATLADHRRLGLGKALMVEGFRRLQNVGATAAFLGNDVDNVAANRLYESVRMPVFDQECSWQKE